MGPISKQLYNQITGWRVYSVVSPTLFTGISALLYIFFGAPFRDIFYTGLVILCVTCIIWWHWSMSTMASMLAIMKDTDDHFETVTSELRELKGKLPSKPNLTVIKPLDPNK